jgi:hypothetical protein
MDSTEVRDELEALGPDGFGERYGRFFLVVVDRTLLEELSLWVNTASRMGQDLVRERDADRAAYLPIMDRDTRASVKNNRFVVGREKPAAIVLSHQNVSKVHAHFRYAGGMLTLADAGSKNGTRLNGMALAANDEVPVDLGDTLEFGNVSTTIWGIDDLVAALGTSGG